MRISKLLLIAALPLAAADDTPAWVRDAAGITLPKFDARVPAVVLLNEQHVVVDPSGQRTSRRAVRILSTGGPLRPRGPQVYVTGTGKVREMRGWMIPPSGETRRYGKDKIADVGLVENDVYNDYRSARDPRRARCRPRQCLRL